MGEFDDGFEDELECAFVTMFQTGHTDGYTHFYGGPLYESKAAADFASKKQHGNYAIESKMLTCIRMLKSKQVYIVDGPYKTFRDVEMEEEIKKGALAKLSDVEKKVLGIK